MTRSISETKKRLILFQFQIVTEQCDISMGLFLYSIFLLDSHSPTLFSTRPTRNYNCNESESH